MKNDLRFYVSNASQTLHYYEMHGFLGISNFVLFANFMRTWDWKSPDVLKVCALLQARVKYKALEQRAQLVYLEFNIKL